MQCVVDWTGVTVLPVCADYQRHNVTPGMALHLNCSSPCLPNEATVTWSLLLNHTRPAVALPTDNSGDYVVSRNHSLVILSVNASRHQGTFQCLYNSQLLTQHTVSLSGKLFAGVLVVLFSLIYFECFLNPSIVNGVTSRT